MVTKTRETAPPSLDQVEHTDDVVEFTLRCVMALAPNLSETIARMAEAHVRESFGGARVYVGRRCGDGAAARNEAIRRDHAAGERIGMLERRYGLGRIQLWRIINGVPNR